MVVSAPLDYAEGAASEEIPVSLLPYPVAGASWEAISSGWASRGLPGNTVYQFEYRSTMGGEGADCTVSSVELDWSVQVELPAWTPPRKAPHALVSRWEEFSEALLQHEVGHRGPDRRSSPIHAVAA